MRFKNESFSLRFSCISQAVNRFVKLISFNSCSTQVSFDFLPVQDVVSEWLILVYLTSVQFHVQLHDNRLKPWYRHYQLQNLPNGIGQINFDNLFLQIKIWRKCLYNRRNRQNIKGSGEPFLYVYYVVYSAYSALKSHMNI